MTRRLLYTLSVASLAAMLAVFAACGDDDDDDGGGGSEEDRQEVADVSERLATTNGAEATQEEIDFYLAHVTDEFLQEFGTESVEECEASAAECIGEPLPGATLDPANVEVDGDEATAIIDTEIGPIGLDLVKEDDTWKANGSFVGDDDLPEGAEVVDVSMTEFAFEGDFESDAVKSGDFAFHISNDGDQPHEAILVPLPDEGTIDEILQDESFAPEPIFVKLPYGPDDESDVALPQPLTAGRYGLVCFFPDTDDPEGTPHAFKGMASEFTVE